MNNLIESARATIGTCDCPCQDPTIERLCGEIERLESLLNEANEQISELQSDLYEAQNV